MGTRKNRYCPATHPDIRYNRKGKIRKCCGEICTTETQTITVDGTPAFWTIQNSWGAGWGNGGFMDIEITGGVGVVGINREMQYVRV